MDQASKDICKTGHERLTEDRNRKQMKTVLQREEQSGVVWSLIVLEFKFFFSRARKPLNLGFSPGMG